MLANFYACIHIYPQSAFNATICICYTAQYDTYTKCKQFHKMAAEMCSEIKQANVCAFRILIECFRILFYAKHKIVKQQNTKRIRHFISFHFIVHSHYVNIILFTLDSQLVKCIIHEFFIVL